MKMKYSMIITAAFAFALTSCDKKETSTQAPESKKDSHAGHGHVHSESCNHGHDHSGHDHGDGDHGKKVAGPNGGRIMSGTGFKLEFFVTDDRKVKITMLDDHNKPLAITEQEVSLVGGDRAKPTHLSFAKAGDGMSLTSSGALPEGNNFPVIISIKPKADAETVRAKMSLNLSDCSSCDYKEYACTCDHGHDHHGHSH